MPKAQFEGVQLRSGPVTDAALVEDMISAEKIREYLHRTMRLSDEAFEDFCHDLGYRAALRVLS